MNDIAATPLDGRLRRLLGKAENAFARLRREDPEALHDLRVSVRRLRATLASCHHADLVGKACRKLRDVAQRTGALRNTEVTVEWLRDRTKSLPAAERPGGEWLIAHFERRLMRQRAKVHRQLVKRWPRVSAAVENAAEALAGPAACAASHETIARYAEALARRLDALRAAPDNFAAAHKTRLAAKRLRYTLEPWAETVEDAEAAVGALTALQEDMGVLNDCVEILHALEGAIRRAAVEHAEHLFAATLDTSENTPARHLQRPDPLPGVLALARLAREERQTRHRAAWRRHVGAGRHPALRFAERAVEQMNIAQEDHAL